MIKFEITNAQIKEMCQGYHNKMDQNGGYSNNINDAVKEELLIRFEEWLDNEVDWDGIEDTILEDDQEAKKDYYERKQDYEDMVATDKYSIREGF